VTERAGRLIVAEVHPPHPGGESAPGNPAPEHDGNEQAQRVEEVL
jgi:hypothetical protein